MFGVTRFAIFHQISTRRRYLLSHAIDSCSQLQRASDMSSSRLAPCPQRSVFVQSLAVAPRLARQSAQAGRAPGQRAAQIMADADSSRWAHLLQPIRELGANWDVDIAADLSDYLSELEQVVFTFDGGHTALNFAEGALLGSCEFN